VEIIQALEITAAGMGLVFLGILALWGMMALLVFLFKDRLNKKEAEGQLAVGSGLQQKAAAAAVAVVRAGYELRQQTAAAAVATLLSCNTFSSMNLERPATTASSWQIVHRLDQINLRNNTFTRKPRGNR
jgi:Na+-transporting methylmalonyl-CoA/oxaloacetate decarboxylase gamma subunit